MMSKYEFAHWLVGLEYSRLLQTECAYSQFINCKMNEYMYKDVCTTMIVLIHKATMVINISNLLT